ncbi:hypothetical protein B0H12DRAFT_1128910 [Mycena haematopus]|nr:hypothetical protein B0H12DRAFT_1128896 [Mycena haematopus]KAJ7244610.1 hypothetical protein B0H12DRAFT_1128910 [Mycena haematopus]
MPNGEYLFKRNTCSKNLAKIAPRSSVAKSPPSPSTPDYMRFAHARTMARVSYTKQSHGGNFGISEFGKR